MIYPEIDPVFLDLGPLKLRWYGLMYLCGFAGAWWLGRVMARRPNSVLTPEQVEDLIFYGAIGVILGGRIGEFFFYEYDKIFTDPLALFRIWEGGMSFHGGFIGVIAAIWLYARKLGVSFLALGDFIAVFSPIGLFFGRIGNFINGELWGAPGDVAWAMQVSCQNRYDLCINQLQLPHGTVLTPPLHPTQLYEAALEGLVLFFVIFWFVRKPRPVMSVSGVFMLGYGVFRFMVEFVRMPESHQGYIAFDWLTVGQLLSTPMILGGVLMIYLAYRNKNIA